MGLRFDPIEEAGRNWARRGWGAIPSMRAATSITRAHQILGSRIDAALAPLGLNFSRFEVLALLSFTKEGQLPMGKIGDRLQVHAASVTNTVNRLEADGLVGRVPHPDDGRTVLAVLTAQGRRLAGRGAAALEAIDYGLEGLGDDDLDAAWRSLIGFRAANGDFAVE
jgi:DNA-binding MarR family transcriptional regulator